MNHGIEPLSLSILVIGAIVVAAVGVRAVFRRVGVPPLIGFIVLGFVIRLADSHWDYLSDNLMGALGVLAGIGIFALLFRVGLETNVRGLIGELPRAVAIWIGNVTLSGVLGYVAARYLLAFPLIPSLFAGVALTATSIGVSV